MSHAFLPESQMLNRYDASRRCNTAGIYSNILRIFYTRTLKNKSKNLSPSPKLLNFAQPEKGKMPEWSIGTVSKTVVPLRVPRVRIPVFPPTTKGCKSNDAQPFVVRKGGMRTRGSSSRSAFAAQRRKNPCLSANDKRLQVNRRAAFCRKERRDENPGDLISVTSDFRF